VEKTELCNTSWVIRASSGKPYMFTPMKPLSPTGRFMPLWKGARELAVK
jgi:hypothetical protein